MRIDRDELARILEIVAKDGLEGPRDLDVALDAIEAVIKAGCEKRCGTCKWFDSQWVDFDDLDSCGSCTFPRERLPESMAGFANREREPVKPSQGTTCPGWEMPE